MRLHVAMVTLNGGAGQALQVVPFISIILLLPLQTLFTVYENNKEINAVLLFLILLYCRPNNNHKFL